MQSSGRVWRTREERGLLRLVVLVNGGQVSQHRAAHLGCDSRIRFPTIENVQLTHWGVWVRAHLDEAWAVGGSMLCALLLQKTKQKQNNIRYLFPGVPERCGHTVVSLARCMEGKSECVLTNHSLLPPTEGRGGGWMREHSEECKDWITGDESWAHGWQCEH